MTTRRSNVAKPKVRKTARTATGRRAAERKQLDQRTRELAEARKLLAEAIQQQTATSEVLQVINSSPSELAPVFDAMLERAMRLCEAAFGGLWVFEGDRYVAAALRGVPPAYASYLAGTTLIPGPQTAPSRFLHGERSAVQNVDLAAEEPYRTGDPQRRALVDLGRARTALQVPLVQNETALGVITIYRQEVRPFSEKQVTLLQNFAAQAVVAMENARLFNETKEALARQTATADVLKVISRSAFDLQTVLDTLVESAVKLSGASLGTIFQRRGDLYHLTADYGYMPEMREYGRANPLAQGMGSNVGRTALTAAVVQIPDVLADPDYTSLGYQRTGNYRAMLGIPLMRDGKIEGVFSLAKPAPGPFAPRQVELVQTFADQALIAIENARLFNETKEALARQTATSDVLKVIASSPSNLQPVFDAIAERSKALIGAHSTVVVRYVEGMIELAAFTPVNPEADALLQAVFPRLPTAGDPQTEKVLRGEIAQISDAELELQGNAMQDTARARGWRSRLLVPLKDDTGVVGWISITRKEAGGFTEKDVELLRTFADQAVIAISNVELFQQLQNRTKELSDSLQFQTATSEVLKVISRSPDRLQPVLDAIVETSRELCGSDASTIFLLRDRMFHFAAMAGTAPKNLQDIRTSPLNVDEPGSLFGRLLRQKQTLHYANVMDDAELSQGRTGLGGPRALLVAPLMNQAEVIGAIVLRQSHLRPFTERQIQAIEVFADQAVIAISNVGLFEQVQQRTRELLQSLDDLRAAQDRLVQTEKLASLGQLTAGIAHEIKNPLNFVNNFSALSAELTGELNDLLKDVTLTDKMREEVEELTRLLRDNLAKVVQHGKRADSIVKNMLLHSRSGSGEHRPVEINAIVEESLNLAYHGARAEGRDFNITLERDFDEAGVAHIYPQEITRVLLNLISNGLYAAAKRASASGNGCEPKLKAATRNLGDKVEVRIRDNGMGIPPDIREKIFNPFFTTKPAGEGTGLGLSMSHDIVVKQHGGTIDVVTEPGSFTEFIITLPRVMPAQETGGQRN